MNPTPPHKLKIQDAESKGEGKHFSFTFLSTFFFLSVEPQGLMHPKWFLVLNLTKGFFTTCVNHFGFDELMVYMLQCCQIQ